MTVRSRRIAALLPLGAIAVLAALWPSEAFAWGPLAHLEFSSSALQAASGLSVATRMLLSGYVSEFLYGSLAADIIVGKNLARYAVHCHNWTVGFRVLDEARGDAQKAFSLGFLAHLAADTIAHNYYVPYKTVQGFQRRGTGHAYWELRYDQQLSPQLWKLARQVCAKQYREHDEHLQNVLCESHVLPFSFSRGLFGSLLLVSRLKKWQRMSHLLAAPKVSPLHIEEVHECRKLAVEQIASVLRDGPSAQCVLADPTGGRNLHLANELRLRLKERADLAANSASKMVTGARAAFRSAIWGRCELPSFSEKKAA